MSETLYTIGYAGHSPDDFRAKLLAAGVELLVDVRRLPLSRKHGFSKRSLAAHLAASGIEYRHLPALGVEREMRNQLKKGLPINACFAAFRAQLTREPAGLIELVQLLAAHTCCLMCVEADVACCHRSVVAEAISARVPGLRVTNL